MKISIIYALAALSTAYPGMKGPAKPPGRSPSEPAKPPGLTRQDAQLGRRVTFDPVVQVTTIPAKRPDLTRQDAQVPDREPAKRPDLTRQDANISFPPAEENPGFSASSQQDAAAAAADALSSAHGGSAPGEHSNPSEHAPLTPHE